jgi:hypothetical protein
MRKMEDRAVKTLFETYWSPRGWKPEESRATSLDDLAYAKSKRVMFDPAHLDHAQAVEQVLGAIGRLNKRKVADAFLASLSTRRLDWRSALGSYAVFQHLPSHKAQIEGRRCMVCGFYLNDQVVDLNILNFERLKWGGVRHDQLDFAAMDLGLFLEIPLPTPTTDDIQKFKDILSSINAAPAKTSSASLQSYFPQGFNSNKAERDRVIAILGFCGILGTPMHPGYSDAFVPSDRRHLPDRHFIDMSYPACWWRREDGVNQHLVQEYFGHAL